MLIAPKESLLFLITEGIKFGVIVLQECILTALSFSHEAIICLLIVIIAFQTTIGTIIASLARYQLTSCLGKTKGEIWTYFMPIQDFKGYISHFIWAFINFIDIIFLIRDGISDAQNVNAEWITQKVVQVIDLRLLTIQHSSITTDGPVKSATAKRILNFEPLPLLLLTLTTNPPSLLETQIYQGPYLILNHLLPPLWTCSFWRLEVTTHIVTILQVRKLATQLFPMVFAN